MSQVYSFEAGMGTLYNGLLEIYPAISCGLGWVYVIDEALPPGLNRLDLAGGKFLSSSQSFEDFFFFRAIEHVAVFSLSFKTGWNLCGARESKCWSDASLIVGVCGDGWRVFSGIRCSLLFLTRKIILRSTKKEKWTTQNNTPGYTLSARSSSLLLVKVEKLGGKTDAADCDGPRRRKRKTEGSI